MLLSVLYPPFLSHSFSVYPPNLYPFVVSMKVIVIPLLSQCLWKSSEVEPSLVFLNNNSEVNSLLFNQDLTDSWSNCIFELK